MKSNTTEKRTKIEITGHLEWQLLEVQRAAGDMQEKLAEARSIKTLYDRSASSFQYGQMMDCMVEASEYAERLTERLRRLVLGNTYDSLKKEEYCFKLVQIHEIHIAYENHILKAELPFLLPHRKNKYTDYIYKPFFLALQDWCMERQKGGKEIPVYKQAIVCFVHEYNQMLPKSRIRDHDNIEEKQVVDALGTYFLLSDNGLYLDTYHTTARGERDCTFLFLMDRDRFPGWIVKRQPPAPVSKNETDFGDGISTG